MRQLVSYLARRSRRISFAFSGESELGFDTLSTLVNGVLSLEGGLELDLGLGLRLAAGFIGLREGSEPGAQVRLSVPQAMAVGAKLPGTNRL